MKELVRKFFSRVNSSLLVAIGMALLVVGCAATQKIKVNSEPLGAKVIVKGVQMAETPAVIKLPTKETNIILRIEKEGYEPVEVALERSLNSWEIVKTIGAAAGASFLPQIIKGGTTKGPVMAASVGFIVGGGVGLVYGFGSGGFYKLSPSEVNIVMNKLKEQGMRLQDISRDEVIIVDMETIRK